jgi:hypothetical protein
MPVYVQHEVLGKVGDVFDAHAIWQAPGLALFARRPLLRDLLERSPREHHGRAPTRCFSHVTLMLPQEEVDDDRHLTRGARARDLAGSLRALHQKDFGDLLGDDDVRYDVVGTDHLPPGEVEVRFGHAVYLPTPDEPVLYQIAASRDSAVWKPVCPLYQEQRLLLLGGDAPTVSHAVPGWPFGAVGGILLINDGPDAALEVQVRPKHALDCVYDPLSACYVVRQHGEAGPRLLLRVTRMGARTAVATAGSKHPVWKQRAGADAPGAIRIGGARGGASIATGNATGNHAADGAAGSTAEGSAGGNASISGAPVLAAGAATASPAATATARARPLPAGAERVDDATAVPAPRAAAMPTDAQATYAPVARQRAALVALALPRLSRYRDTGADALCIGFDANLRITADAAQAVLRLVVDSADQLTAVTDAGSSPVPLPSTFTPVDQRPLRITPVPAQLADRYLALVGLAQPDATGIVPGARLMFGRAEAPLSQLRILNGTGFVRQGPAGTGGSADRLGLSRQAFSFESTAQGYHIIRASASQALYHLDPQLRFVAAIGAASADQPYLLPAGHHLVAGHYVLRFDA